MNIFNKKINNEYAIKINYKFHKTPNLKYKQIITNQNYNGGANDIFEVYLSYKDNKEYVASPNIRNSNVDIFILMDNQKLLSLKGHNFDIRIIRYFINNKNYNEYLISADNSKTVIVWDITNSYNIKYIIKTKYEDHINSCLLVFPLNINDNYIITSSNCISDDIDISATNIYSLNNGNYIKSIKNSNNYYICYLLSWYNKKNNNYYLIEFAYKKIVINNILKNDLYCELIKEPEIFHNSGFIFNKRNNDYLCCSSTNGYINIWDLYNKNIYKIINTNHCFLMHIINWNNKYIIVADLNNNSFKIFEMELGELISNIKQKANVVSIKKIYHPIYGESLLSVARDNTIRLWHI